MFCALFSIIDRGSPIQPFYFRYWYWYCRFEYLPVSDTSQYHVTPLKIYISSVVHLRSKTNSVTGFYCFSYDRTCPKTLKLCSNMVRAKNIQWRIIGQDPILFFFPGSAEISESILYLGMPKSREDFWQIIKIRIIIWHSVWNDKLIRNIFGGEKSSRVRGWTGPHWRVFRWAVSSLKARHCWSCFATQWSASLPCVHKRAVLALQWAREEKAFWSFSKRNKWTRKHLMHNGFRLLLSKRCPWAFLFFYRMQRTGVSQGGFKVGSSPSPTFHPTTTKH